MLFNDKRSNFPPSSGKRQEYPLLFNIVLKVLASSIRQEKETKGIYIGKKVGKYFLKRIKS